MTTPSRTDPSLTSAPVVSGRMGRPTERQDFIVEEIRDRIVTGQWLPGSRLPNREEIGQEYGAGANTVQRALDRLRLDGFVESRGRGGTHVTAQPPHLSRYAVVFPETPSHPYNWLRFWTALRSEAVNLERNEGRKLPLYYDVFTDWTQEDFRLLDYDVRNRRLAGIFFATSPFGLEGSSILQDAAIPMVRVMERTADTAMPSLVPDLESFFERAITSLHDSGCRRVAFLLSHGQEAKGPRLKAKVESLGMKTLPQWLLTFPVSLPHIARNVTHLLCGGPAMERPDGLIIGDDNFVEYATAGVLAAGLTVPDQIRIVAHCNFPWPTPSLVPIQRLGFDAREILHGAIALMDAMRRGEKVPDFTDIPARFEHEISAVTQR